MTSYLDKTPFDVNARRGPQTNKKRNCKKQKCSKWKGGKCQGGKQK